MIQARKTPAEALDYGVDWRRWLNGDRIASSSWFVEPGIDVAAADHDDENTLVFLTGGTVGQKYWATNRITTVSGGQTAERSIRITVVERRRK